MRVFQKVMKVLKKGIEEKGLPVHMHPKECKELPFIKSE